MIRYAEIQDGVVRHVGKNAFLPVFSPVSGVLAVDITGEAEVGIDWHYVDGHFIPPAIVEAAPAQQPAAHLTHYEFYKRLPPAKYLALLRRTEPASGADYDPDIEYSFRLLAAARFVDLGLADVIGGVRLMVAKAVITEPEAEHLLTPTLLPGETGA
ncbi:MAG: hypothetical protein HYV16_16455 [Gammaproteobacteria bacterium]|nr:hypothetical protein [Gammaproteobacteria bacterium]